jgi:hypothetical protein
MRVSEEAPGVAMMSSVVNGTSSHVSRPTGGGGRWEGGIEE